MTRTTEVFEYTTLRLLIGVIAIIFPFVCLAAFIIVQHEATGAYFIIPTSISATYHFGARDLFVGGLFIVGSFLLAYNGRKLPSDEYDYERVASKFAAGFAFFVALFPTSINTHWMNCNNLIPIHIPCQRNCDGCWPEICHVSGQWVITGIHQFSAVALILILFFFCYRFFRRAGKKVALLQHLNKPDYAKDISRIKWRKQIYRICFIGMFVSLLGAILVFWFKTALFYVELFCLVFFG